MPSNHLILCRPLLLPSIFPSVWVFSKESALPIRWPKDWSFSFNISPSNEHPGLTSFRMYWLDLLAVQGTLKSLLQHHSSEALWLMVLILFSVWCARRIIIHFQVSVLQLCDPEWSSCPQHWRASLQTTDLRSSPTPIQTMLWGRNLRHKSALPELLTGRRSAEPGHPPEVQQLEPRAALAHPPRQAVGETRGGPRRLCPSSKLWDSTSRGWML